MTRLTPVALREFLLTASEAEVNAYWVWLQQEKRAHGEAHYTTLYEPVTGRVVATI